MTAGAISTVGGLLTREFLERLNHGDPALLGLKPTNFELAPSERLRDAVTRSWNRLAALWTAFKREEQALPDTDDSATRLTRERWLLPLLSELGFAGLDAVQSLTPGSDGKTYAISHEWRGRVPVHLMGWRTPIDRRTPGLPGAAKASPHGLLQEFLNSSDAHLWGIVSNGRVLRLLRDNASLTRQAYVEFDLTSIFDGESFADFTQLWLCCHRTRFEGDTPARCLLEQWHKEAAAQGTRAREKLRSGVEQAIVCLGNGVLAHSANSELRARLRGGELTADDLQRQLLRVVYRMLFLLVAESRSLLLAPDAPADAKDRYERFYSMRRLRRLASARRGGAHSDLWQALGVTMAALDIGDELPQRAARKALGLTSLGSLLWAQEETADLDLARIDNAHLLEAVRHLAFVHDDEARLLRPVDYQNLGTEELGSVYESLLELHAIVDPDDRSFGLGSAAGSERKTTGSYYTPPKLISRLLDEALNPVIAEARAKSEPEQALLDLKVLDPACGSGHFLIAAAHRIADALASTREGGVEPSPEASRVALREVVGNCLYAIDINPMAVELCKVSLWLESNTPGKPLSFLDHRIICGNSLLGTTPRLLAEGVPDTAFKLLKGDDRQHVSALRKANRKERKDPSQGVLAPVWTAASEAALLASGLHQIDVAADDTAEQVASKQEEYARLRASAPAEKAKLIADAWCAAFVARKTPADPPITDKTLRALQARSSDQLVVDVWASHQNGASENAATAVNSIRRLAYEYQFTHLHLAFPNVFTVPEDPDDATNDHTGWSGGFDAVVGNPPFLNQLRDLTVTHRRIANLQAVRFSGFVSSLTDSAYLFLTLSCQAARPTGGHVGLVQPESLLAADGAQELRHQLPSMASFEFLWVAGEKMFNANVLTCVLVVRVDHPVRSQATRRARGADFEPLSDLQLSTEELVQMPTWSPLIADGFGVPRVDLRTSARLGDVLSATADFRDQYYGIAPFVTEVGTDSNEDAALRRLAPLITVGLIDPLHSLWGKMPTRFNKCKWNAPAVDIGRLRSESDLSEWVDRRLVPKLLVATQTPVLEVVPDEEGIMLPSVPVITVVPKSISIWHAAALLSAPALTAWAAARHLGASLSTSALKLSARQIEDLPLPQGSEAWDAAAAHAHDAFLSESADGRAVHLQLLAQWMCRAFEIRDSAELITWWTDRLPSRRDP
ncbi:MAG: N-6 DNA methylase [Acidimicrobiaceae bacterium]|nr:N-6 DNA methylase [Acidimicrobiaceae bacterium]MYF42904.1 N-6 DNA methylase [Acidimicrobiaceae bacterium]